MSPSGRSFLALGRETMERKLDACLDTLEECQKLLADPVVVAALKSHNQLPLGLLAFQLNARIKDLLR